MARASSREAEGVKESLLYLCQLNPWPLSGGGLIRDFWTIKALARRFSIDLVTADLAEPPPAEFAALCRDIRSFPRPAPSGNAGRMVRAVRALRPNTSILTANIVSRALRAHVRELVARNRYRLVMFDLPMYGALPPGAPPLVYHAHNCETALFARRLELERLPLRALLRADARRLRAIESEAAARASCLLCCSQEDVSDLAALADDVSERAIVAANGVDVARYETVRMQTPPGGRILITGSFTWRPNQLGLEWFTSNVVPRLEERAAGFPFEIHVAGRMSPAYAARISKHPRIVAVPNPPDMRSELTWASVVAVPVLASSGTRLRILEAWAAGRPVVTTEAGAFGLEVWPGSDIAVYAEAKPFADALWGLLKNVRARASLAAAGTARSRDYDWNDIGGRLLADFEDAFPRRTARTADAAASRGVPLLT
jgi:glycosyltransferase involved in cell wall biosynthesis